ncbi:hypothetical protein FOZ63_013512 [Perkinsus olseni]|uniref:O-phosphoseryl-tRNA(Sec) selenium transferase n=1 Tax=Perkinsus olseni TaxID=32597 RepID=A0A7J6SM55_PEROL|nr:hypothetical protein FOZ63_013512 [Perkinsus olseni]
MALKNRKSCMLFTEPPQQIIVAAHAVLARDSVNSEARLVSSLLSQRRLPLEPWTDQEIKSFLLNISSWDTNNFRGNIGVGEREGRYASNLVYERNFGLMHGIGRSGDIAAVQPKAAGSSLILRLTRYLVADAIRLAGIPSLVNDVPKGSPCLLPVATGMAITLVLLAVMKRQRAAHPNVKYVVWSRIDQKSCLKAMQLAGLEVVSVDQKQSDSPAEQGLVTDVEAIREKIRSLGGAESVVAIVGTTSTFAPRSPDDIPALGRIAKEFDIPLVVNNAYGLQCTKCCSLIEETSRASDARVDAVVQSTDKNFLVPIGGSIVIGRSDLVSAVGAGYPGRASMSPILDLFITLLSLGKSGWMAMLKKRRDMFKSFKTKLQQWTAQRGLRVLEVPWNRISLAIDLSSLNLDSGTAATEIGSALFTRRVSGPRVVLCENGPSKNIGSMVFSNYGSHSEDYSAAKSYMTCACAIGCEQQELDEFLVRFDHVLRDLRKKEKSISREQA